jgi:hypothetical protein
MYCVDNPLETLTMNKNIWLCQLNISSNQLSTSALNSVFRSLHDIPLIASNFRKKFIGISYNPGSRDCDVSIAVEKGWNVFNGWDELSIDIQRLAIPELYDFDDRIFEEERWRQWHQRTKNLEEIEEQYLNFLKQLINNNLK